ncbi:MAG: hypothetical protein HY367_02285 [Candidatus Aenigmarchaeota archaeon]|nr:hypothetical protein [Candidatus Aenigmarchaeota archaeon]
MDTMPGIILAMLLVLLISGCTSASPGGGLAIKYFAPDLPQALPGERIRLQAEIENTGSSEATAATARILGLESWLGQSLTPDCEAGFSLLPARLGISGSTNVCSWEFTAPDVPDRINVNFKPALRVEYVYSSDLVKAVTILPREQLVLLRDQPLPSETTSVSSSPVAFSAEVQTPVRLAGSEVSFPLKITVNNVGGGAVCIDDCSEANNIDSIYLAIDAKGMSTDCPNPIRLTLYRGSTNTIQCNMMASGLNPNAITQKAIKIRSDRESGTAYRYFTDAETQVTVTGRP